MLMELKKKVRTPSLAAMQLVQAINEDIGYILPCAYKKSPADEAGLFIFFN